MSVGREWGSLMNVAERGYGGHHEYMASVSIVNSADERHEGVPSVPIVAATIITARRSYCFE